MELTGGVLERAGGISEWGGGVVEQEGGRAREKGEIDERRGGTYSKGPGMLCEVGGEGRRCTARGVTRVPGGTVVCRLAGLAGEVSMKGTQEVV